VTRTQSSVVSGLRVYARWTANGRQRLLQEVLRRLAPPALLWGASPDECFDTLVNASE